MSWNDLWILLKKYRYVDSDCFNIRYIRLYTRQVLSTNSSPKLCIQSTLVNFPRNPSDSFKIYLICKIVSRDWIFHDFDTLTNIAENGCTRKNPDIWYCVCVISFSWKPCVFQHIGSFTCALPIKGIYDIRNKVFNTGTKVNAV